MKKIFFMSLLFSLAVMGLVKVEAQSRNWLKRYGIDVNNTNPVFTRPDRENDSDRVQGAGIHMNDGAAYNRRYYTFGGEWHYEPKLHLCQEEEAVAAQIFGAYSPSGKIETLGQILKYGVIPTDFGAIAAYRHWDDSGNEREVRHHYATFNHKGELIDAFYAGSSGWMNRVLMAEPHGPYTAKHNFGGGAMEFSADNKTLTKTDYYYYTPDDANGSTKWEDSTIFNISPEGIFSVASHKSSHKPAVNEEADELYLLETLPLSDKEAIAKWNAFVKHASKNEQLKDRLANDIFRLFISRRQEFMAWTTKHKNESVLIGALKPGMEQFAQRYGTGSLQMLLEKSLIECKDSAVRNYWKNLKTIRSIFESY